MKALSATIALAAFAARASGAGGSMDTQAAEPVDLTPWTYVWRSDRKAQPEPEAYFIPRRLERLDRVYRTARQVLSPAQLKSIYYNMPDMLKQFPPKPRGRLVTGMLWTGGLSDYTVELRWSRRAATPAAATVEVRSYPTSFGWFGWTADRVLPRASASPDGRVWSYRSDPTELMDSSYNARVPAATEMLAVFVEAGATGAEPPVPELRLTSPQLGVWREIGIEIEWGFAAGTRAADFQARLETHTARIVALSPLPGNDGTSIVGRSRLASKPSGAKRRGVALRLLYAPDARPGLDSRLTLWRKSEGATFRIKDLDSGPILLPRHGLFVSKAGEGHDARESTQQLAARDPRSIRGMTREHHEPASFEALMREARLWACPPETKLAPFPSVPEAPMKVRLSDEGWTSAWRAAANQLTGAHMWGGLAFEVARVTHAMDLIGLHEHSDKVYKHFLDGPGAKPDGDYSDGRGALEWATSMRHDMGYSHDGTHASTGRLLYSMCERCLLTADRVWFLSNVARLQAAADWIIRQRKTYMAHVPNRGKLLVAGLMPPCMLGDYALPACDWHWYYVDNALAVQALSRFADALKEFAPDRAPRYRTEAEAFRRDLLRAVRMEAALSPVRLGRDGAYHSFVPRMAYARGLTGPELGAPQFPDCDWWMGALPLAEPYAGLDAADPILADTLDMMEEMGTSPGAVRSAEAARTQKGLPGRDAWFYHTYSILPKASHIANAYLLQDDVPNFLRFWMTHYAVMVGADGKLWEHAHPGGYDVCGAPDNGTAGWFIENFRNLLVMEEGASLWIARGTPRAWLEQGRTISVADAPTVFGPVGYEIRSDVDHERIEATVRVPERKRPTSVILRFRHPRAARMTAVTVQGRRWTRFDPDRETIRLTGLSGDVRVTALYAGSSDRRPVKERGADGVG